MRTRLAPFLLLGSLGAACGGSPSSVVPTETILRNASGADVGRVLLRERGGRLELNVRVQGLPPGDHGMHLHATGLCEGPDFQSAGPHLNPTKMKHGHQSPQGPHVGDLGNIRVGDDGRGERTVDIVSAEARGGIKNFLGPAGLALIVHAGLDDEKTDPSGNSGPRVACAVLM